MNNTKNFASIILAAGVGTRMKSDLPKVMHKILGKEMLSYVLDTIKQIKEIKKNIVVVGHKKEIIINHFSKSNLVFAEQKKMMGSGDAVKSGIKYLPKNFDGTVLILCGDTPIISKETLKSLLNTHEKEKNSVTILTSYTHNPFGYGRIKRNVINKVVAIVEEKDASVEEKLIKEINSGIYCFDYKYLKNSLDKIKPNNKKNEYYLTDCIQIILELGGSIGTSTTNHFRETMGINTRKDLADASRVLQNKILEKWMLEGVTIINPDNVYIENNVVIEKDTIIFPGVMLFGNTKIGSNCAIGPNTTIINTKVGNNSDIKYSYVAESVINKNVKIGPFSHIRPNTILKDNTRVGNFTEIKSSVIETGSKVSHLSYIGDTSIDENVNVGAGTITCNYDGKNKHKTKIKQGAFIGSNTNLVAPVIIGKGAVIAAGSTINENVPDKALAIARAKQINKLNWNKK
jgi:bifunctional UDP-N-acetylglucosamine pyrophosphorylase / glucosamine-1-phosphate N-acetyltransferase